MATKFMTLGQAQLMRTAQQLAAATPLGAPFTQVKINPFIPAGERAAVELAKTGGSLNAVANGRLIRISAGPQDWEISTPWRGREITSWAKRYSNWDKMITVSFYVELSSSAAKLPTFTLALKPPLTDDEVTGAAEVYMSLLNLARTE